MTSQTKIKPLLLPARSALELSSSKSTSVDPCARIERWVLRLMSYRYKVIYKPGKTNIADPLSRLCEPVMAKPCRSKIESQQYVNWVCSNAEPKAIKIVEILEVSKHDDSILAVKDALNNGVWSDKSSPYKIFELKMCFSGDILLRGMRIVMPSQLRERSLQIAHEGHPGISVMKRWLRAKVWWPGLDRDVEAFVKRCFGCTLVTAPPPPEPMRRTELPSKPWQHIAIDYCGVLPSGDHLLVIVDYYSRFIEVEVLKKIDSGSTIRRLRNIFARFGFPDSITADNGPQFVSKEFRDYCNINNIQLKNTTPFWPQQNGEVERQNRSILKRLTISQNTGRNWKEDLHQYLLMYRSTPHSVTLRSPAELMFNRQIKDKLPTINTPRERDEELMDRDREQKAKMKEYVDGKRRAKQIEIKIGDSVLLKRQHIQNKLDSTFEPTIYKVVNRSGSEIIVESTKTSAHYRRNVSHAKLVSSDSMPSADSPPPNEIIQASRKRSTPAVPDHAVAVPDHTSIDEPDSSKRTRKPPSKFRDYV